MVSRFVKPCLVALPLFCVARVWAFVLKVIYFCEYSSFPLDMPMMIMYHAYVQMVNVNHLKG